MTPFEVRRGQRFAILVLLVMALVLAFVIAYGVKALREANAVDYIEKEYLNYARKRSFSPGQINAIRARNPWFYLDAPLAPPKKRLASID